jgi:LacI family transcriptional regulator
VGIDVAVTGFDDIPPAEHSHPPLTTVRQPIYQIGKMVCQMLIRLLRGEPLEETHVILQPTLVIRASTMGGRRVEEQAVREFEEAV